MSHHEVVVEAAKSAPPVTVAAWLTTGNELDLWIKGLTILYIVLQIAWLVLKFVRASKNKGTPE